MDLETLRRDAYAGLQTAYRYSGRGYCLVCNIRTEHSLDAHMMCHHLDLGQLWRCPVEWCAVWKGSVWECRDHFNDKHGHSETLDFDKVSKSFPAWTVPRDFWKWALQPEISGILWIFVCSTSPDNEWYTNIGCIGTLYRTRHSARVELQN